VVYCCAHLSVRDRGELPSCLSRLSKALALGPHVYIVGVHEDASFSPWSSDMSFSV